MLVASVYPPIIATISNQMRSFFPNNKVDWLDAGVLVVPSSEGLDNDQNYAGVQ
jgi:hypothetical protein